jgi:actin-related protein
MNEAEQSKQDLLKEVAGRLTELLAMKDRELEAQKQKNAELQKQINENREKDKRESEAQKELRKLQAKFEKLSARYESLLNYTTQLEAPDDDAVDEGVPLDEELLKKQRIVFVRDKKHEGYVIMQKLADYFPNARFTNCIASEINAKTTDLIVQMIPYVCHGTYWGAESVAERKNVPMLSIRNTNPDVMIAKINEAIQRKLAKQS